jgi:hypothetical protein
LSPLRKMAGPSLSGARGIGPVPLGAYRRAAIHVQNWVDASFRTPWPSYVLVALLQLKVMWNIWRFRDLTSGDTSSYFVSAYHWYEGLRDNFAWSPLYTSFYGTVFTVVPDAYAATIIHRAIIAMAATLGVLALMRRLLPPALALSVAIWWAVLPINFDTLYEIHLFALLPVLAACLVVAYRDTSGGRGSALAILLGATVLLRNELIVASVLFALICLLREISSEREMGGTKRAAWRRYVASYGLPIAVAAAVSAFYYSRSQIQYPELSEAFRSKHALNMCQVYAFGYAQRHPDWKASPWVECGPLMEATFGEPQPSLLQMVVRNPRATSEHFGWNMSLAPNGLQLALFGITWGVNPDYAPVTQSPVAWLLSMVVLVIVASGIAVAVRHRSYWWPTWFRPQAGTWLLLFAIAAVAIPVILTQRPRPSYLFATTVVLMAVVGSAVHVLTCRWPKAQRLLVIVGVIALLLAVPPYYRPRPGQNRPLYTDYEILRPFRPLLADRRNVFVIGDFAGELRNYLRLGNVPVATFDYQLLSRWSGRRPLQQFLDDEGVNLIFLQPRMLKSLAENPYARPMLTAPETVGWQRVGAGIHGDSAWLLLARATDASRGAIVLPQAK